MVMFLLSVSPLVAHALDTEVLKPRRFHQVQSLLRVPDMLAHITDASEEAVASAVPEYILIQDVHRHPLVQSRIAALIEQGYDQWGVRKVFLEGAFTPLDMSLFHRVPDKTRTLLISRLVNEGQLSGAEIAAV